MSKDRTRQVLLFGMETDIDFELLQKQKAWLFNQPRCEEVEGLLGFLDWFQDTAESALGDEGTAVVYGEQKPDVVIFRRWRSKPSTVIALFPEIDVGVTKTGVKLCRSYEHVGQHGRANYEMVIHDTRAAKPEEYANLKAELNTIGYVLNVVKHKSEQFRNYKTKKV